MDSLSAAGLFIGGGVGSSGLSSFGPAVSSAAAGRFILTVTPSVAMVSSAAAGRFILCFGFGDSAFGFGFGLPLAFDFGAGLSFGIGFTGSPTASSSDNLSTQGSSIKMRKTKCDLA